MRLYQAALAGLSCVCLAAASSATVLTFDTGVAAPLVFPSSYGNRVSNFDSGQFHYGADGGITPNVNVQYSGLFRMGGTTNPFDPTRVFGDLTNVIYRDPSVGLEPGIMQISFIADPGFEVCLHSFDMAATYNLSTGQGEDLTARSIRVYGQGGVLLYDREYSSLDTSPSSPTSTAIPGTLPLRHRHFDFEAAPLRSSMITIRIDLNNYITIGGTKVDRFGIDNIKISQTPGVPTPGAGALLAIGACIAAIRRRTRA